MSNLEGKVCLITGAAEGIGRAAALKFAAQGATVAVADINEEKLAETLQLLGEEAIAITADVSDDAACQAMVDKTVAAFGKLDVLFNNAGTPGKRAKIAEVTTEEWLRVISVNLNGVFFCSRAAIPAMQNGGGGAIINVASVDGQIGMATLGPYVSTKHAVIGLTRNIAIEYAASNIRCVAVAPGFIDTAMTQNSLSAEEAGLLHSLTPMGRSARPEEVADLVVWLASEQASYITGTCVTVDGGLLAGFGLPD